jgi:nitrite reductase/ring-hydroxylating ferredoxin subunit
MAEASHDKPDLTNGVPENDLDDGAMLVGQVGEEAVLLARRGREVFAIGATCTHYGGPLDERSRGAARATASGVRRDKAALSSGCKSHPAIRSSRKQSEQSWR